MNQPTEPTNYTSSQRTALNRLALSPQQLQALSRQGFVSGEVRGGRRVFKLRFRMLGQQSVKYIGTDAAFAQAVRELLQIMQMQQSTLREMNQLARKARSAIRNTIQQLRPTIEAAGMHFHGHVIRRKRG